MGRHVEPTIPSALCPRDHGDVEGREQRPRRAVLDDDREWVLGRLVAAQAGIAEFKRTLADPGVLDAIVRSFLLSVDGTPYD